MKRILSTLSALLLTIGFVSAADTNSTSFFTSKELTFDTFATYQSSVPWGYGIGLTYYQTENIGISVWTARDNFDWANGKLIQSLDTSLRLRLPLTDTVAPYVTMGNRWLTDTDTQTPVAGLGVQYKFNKKLSAFVEGTYGFGA